MKKRDNRDIMREIDATLNAVVQRMEEIKGTQTEALTRSTRSEQIADEIIEVLFDLLRRIERTENKNENHSLKPRYLLDLLSREN